jgi:hypothetical protein
VKLKIPLDTFRLVVTAHLLQNWPLVCFPPTVSKCDTSQRNLQCLDK